ncbi:MAG TPA: carboxypeptidase regulatory-like domain-containing protein [Candidatus Acidoferrales bacterium]|nr:carboxypeptidase regulatory-like domain-containing protein [Candidatus Acidoferrales bacterium]
MKFRYGTLLLVSITMIISQWGCKKNNIVGTTVPTSAAISGTVTSSLTSAAVTGAAVILRYGGTVDTTYTGNDGTFQLPPIEITSDTVGVNVTLTVSATGFISKTYSNINVKSDMNIPIVLDINPAFYAKIIGVVKDSASTYPLSGASVLITLPGAVDTAATLQNGAFTIYINLEGLSTLQTSMTISKPGFKTYNQNSLLLRSGTDSVGTIFLSVDKGSTIAHLSGLVTDSRTGLPIPSVSVVLSSTIGTDSTKTLGDGTYRFDPNLQGLPSAPMTLTFKSTGYNDASVNFTINSGQSLTENVVMTSNYNYAIITGRVRDSLSGYVLSGAKVIVALTGTVSSNSKFFSSLKSHKRSVSSVILDSTTTFIDGSFSLAVNLFDLDSITATMTVSEPGYKVYQFIHTFVLGANNLGNILVSIDNGLTTSHLTGYVTDSHSALPIKGVSVYLTTPIKVDSTTTSYSGYYSFDLNLQGLSSVSGTLLFRLNSYDDTLINFSVNAGQTIADNVALNAKPTVVGGDSSTARGIARSISLVSITHQEISIHGVGRNETSVLTWQVLDSLGFPIDINHRDTVVFVPTGIPVTGDPQTGAYVTPTYGITDGSGQVYTTMNSGTVAGTVQLFAKLTLSTGATVQSSPVLITIDGGLPDQAHFELNVQKLNFAGYDWSERTDVFTAQAGDKYGNPVAPGTAVYFTTGDGHGNPVGGVMTAAGQTDASGHTNATLYSGKPLAHAYGLDPAVFGGPTDPLLPLLDGNFAGDPTYQGAGTGYVYAKSFTNGENGSIVVDSGLVCLSATAGPILFNDSLSISPVYIHSGGSTVIVMVHISDRFGNPLESGTVITATVDAEAPPNNSGLTWKISADGLPGILGDYLTRGAGSTDFALAVYGSENVPYTINFSVTVTVNGRNTDNGDWSNTFTGVLEP